MDDRKKLNLEDGHTFGMPTQQTNIDELMRNVFGEIGEQIARQRQAAVTESRNNDTSKMLTCHQRDTKASALHKTYVNMTLDPARYSPQSPKDTFKMKKFL